MINSFKIQGCENMDDFKDVFDKLYSDEDIKAQNKQIIELLYQSFPKDEIARRVGISISTLHSRIADLRESGQLPYFTFVKGANGLKKENRLTIREQEFYELYTQGLTCEKIAEKMQINIASIKVYLQRLRDKGILPHNLNVKIKSARIKGFRSTIEGLIDDFLDENDEFLINIGFPNRRSYLSIDIDRVASIVKALGYRSKDVHLLEQLYVERELYEDAIALLIDYESNNSLSPEEIDKIKDIKHNLRLELLKKLTGSIPDYITDESFSPTDINPDDER